MKIAAVCGVVVLAFLANQAGAVIVYNDGLVHEISTTVYEDIGVYDGPSGEPTLVRLLAGAETQDVDVFQNRRFEMVAGEIEDGTLTRHRRFGSAQAWRGPEKISGYEPERS